MSRPKTSIPNVVSLIAVASGKGGVGKTSVTVNLALALSKLGHRVGIFDADLYGPNVPLMLGVQRRKPGHGFVPIARASKEPYIPFLKKFGLQIMSIGLIMGNAQAVTPDPSFVGQIIRQTLVDVQWDTLDVLLVDLPPGTGEPQQTLLNTLDFHGAVLVTTPQDLSLMDTSRALDHFSRAAVPILGYVENMSYLICPCCSERIEVFKRSERKWELENGDVGCLGRVPLDEEISEGINNGSPLVSAETTTPNAQIFIDIAKKLSSITNSD